MIAVGGMGEVFAGRDVKLDRPVAVKLLRREMVDQGDYRDRFEAEARAGGRLTHQAVVAVFDTGVHDSVPFMVMELLTGRTLADELLDGAADSGWSVGVAQQILSALQVAHREGILHRDLKPSNILLAADGSVKVADFGVAKVAGREDLTQTGAMVGTPAYLAPERIEGKPATAASDVYAVGVILFELLAGFKPFQADTPLGLMRAIGLDAPPDLAELRPDLDGAVIEVVNKAMAKHPERRYGTAAAMSAALAPLERPGSALGESNSDAPTQVSVVDEPGTRVVEREGTSNPPTQVLPSGARRGRHRSPDPGLYRLAGLVAAVLAFIVVVMMVSRSMQVSPAPSTSPAAEGSIDPELDDALRDLEEAVNR